MFALLVGAGLGVGLHYLTGETWLLAVVCWAVALPLQVAYARSLYGFLGGVDPVAEYGARNLRELARIIPIPFRIVTLSFVARALWCAGAAALFLLASNPGCNERDQLTQEDESNLRFFAQAVIEKRLATRRFNAAMGSESAVVTIPKEVVAELIEREELALRLSRATRGDVLRRVHPELERMVRDHFDRSLERYVEALRTGSTAADIEAQRHDDTFGDWWGAHRGKMPVLLKVMQRVESKAR